MGHFLAVSAIRDRPISSIAEAAGAYCSAAGVAVEPIGFGEVDSARDALLFTPQNRWTAVLWPVYFNVHDLALCRALSERLATTISAVHVYDDDYWVHALFDRGRTLDRFCSVPDLFAGDELEAAQRKREWLGNAGVLATQLGIDEPQLRPYLRHLDGAVDEPIGKVFPDDEFELEDFWVFTDFWRRCGIAYPADPRTFTVRLRLGADFLQRLPTGDDGL